ncbi:hypothetical protein IAD21_03692 [Abditibacteriota bacterium]|nr:hypothetical protein IAD21_03692 [Abditibacteriota bacterium]
MRTPEDYQLHEINYVMEHFGHLMTEVERAARDAIMLFQGSQAHITFDTKLDENVANAARFALKDGAQVFRRRTTERILSTHRDQVYANACPKCGRLPATPKAKLCIWCSHTWFDGA